MFDRKDVENIGMEYENGLRAGKNDLNETQIKAMRIGFEMGINVALQMVENRVELKETFKRK